MHTDRKHPDKLRRHTEQHGTPIRRDLQETQVREAPSDKSHIYTSSLLRWEDANTENHPDGRGLTRTPAGRQGRSRKGTEGLPGQAPSALTHNVLMTLTSAAGCLQDISKLTVAVLRENGKGGQIKILGRHPLDSMSFKQKGRLRWVGTEAGRLSEVGQVCI